MASGRLSGTFTSVTKYTLDLSDLSCCGSFAQLYPTLHNPVDFTTPGFHVLHHLPELAQTHVH